MHEGSLCVRDVWKKYTQRGIEIFGVSRDSAQSHAEFMKKHELPFPLVADESGKIQAAYGVPSRLGRSARMSVLDDSHGRIAHVWPDVDPGVHADEVLKTADAGQGREPQPVAAGLTSAPLTAAAAPAVTELARMQSRSALSYSRSATRPGTAHGGDTAVCRSHAGRRRPGAQLTAAVQLERAPPLPSLRSR